MADVIVISSESESSNGSTSENMAEKASPEQHSPNEELSLSQSTSLQSPREVHLEQ